MGVWTIRLNGPMKLRELARNGLKLGFDGLLRLGRETEANLALFTPEPIRKRLRRHRPKITAGWLGLSVLSGSAAAATGNTDSAVCGTPLSWIIPTGLSILFLGLFIAGIYRSGIGFGKAGDTNQGNHEQGKDAVSRAVVWNILPSIVVPPFLGYYIDARGLDWLSCVDLSNTGLMIHATDLVTIFL